MPIDSIPRRFAWPVHVVTWGRRGFLGLAMLAMAIGLWQTVGIGGLVFRIRVTESSMAPAFFGEHAVVRCPVCQRRFPVELFDVSAADLRTVCPRCGGLHRLTSPVELRRGDRVLINKWTRHQPKRLRWQAVAVRHPAEREDWLVKRVVGLPGETIELRYGDVYVDGTLQAKSLAEFRSMALPVFDTRAAAPSNSGNVWTRWQPRSPNSPLWRLDEAGYECQRAADDRWSWLAFQGCDRPGTGQTFPLLTDDYAFNQSVSRQLHAVRDVLLRCDVRGFQRGRIACRVTVNGQTAQVIWDVSGRRVGLTVNGQVAVQRRLPHTYIAPRTELEYAICDGRMHFAINRQLVLHAPLPSPFSVTEHGLERLELGVQRGRLTVSRIELMRDLYYLALPSSAMVSGSARRGAIEGAFFVLGDNSPVSEDSRHFGPIPQSDVLGRVVRWSPKGFSQEAEAR